MISHRYVASVASSWAGSTGPLRNLAGTGAIDNVEEALTEIDAAAQAVSFGQVPIPELDRAAALADLDVVADYVTDAGVRPAPADWPAAA